MIRLTELRLPIEHDDAALPAALCTRLGIAPAELLSFQVAKRGYDARRRSQIVFVYTLDCTLRDEAAVLARHVGDPHVKPTPDTRYRFAAEAPADFARGDDAARPVVVGFGPCGLFVALVLAQSGYRPIVLERGKAVRERTQDTWGLWRRSELQPESNVQFGEGGAGTFSDGKLWSQISDPRHLTKKVLEEFVKAGAPEEIAWIAKPHIGTFRLVSMIEKMRAEIERLGGEVRFGRKVVDLVIENGAVRGVVVEPLPTLAVSRMDEAGRAAAAGGAAADAVLVRETLRTDHVVLALGHSARDTFAMLHARGVAMQAKPFSIGFRIEHPQGLIDRARFGDKYAGHPLLGAADYKLVHHAKNGRSVYSFCMCPGGTVVAATSEPERVVTNGMSQYSRNERNANAGIVVGIAPDDYAVPGTPHGAISPLDGIAFQRHWESRAFELGGGGYRAPGQRVGDYLRRQRSSAFGSVEPSYKPGVTPVDLAQRGHESLPAYALDAIREALPAFAKQIRGFDMDDALLTGVETRTSSPLRIPRDPTSRVCTNVRGLYPAGEGAGYAGGIMSAAVDGIETAEALARAITGTPR